MPEANPYDPPRADLGVRRGPAHYRPLVTLARVSVGLWGLFILAGPARGGPGVAHNSGQIAAKALGAVLFLGAVFPVGGPGRGRVAPGPEAEDL